MNNMLSEQEQVVLDKLTMLFVIDKMEIPLTEDSILDICSVKNEWIKNYMDCKAIIHDLTESKLLYKLGDLKKGKELFTLTYTKNEDGSYNVILQIYEPLITTPMFELKIKAPSRQSANEAIHKWKSQAPSIYEIIFNNLININ